LCHISAKFVTNDLKRWKCVSCATKES
jgi:hypothetical protein